MDNFTLDQWLHLIPAAKLLVSIPKTNDKLVVRRFDAEAELAKSGLAYVVVTSHPPEAARQGEEFVYPLDVKTNMAGLTYRLEDGPPGRAIDVAGRLTWKVPADQAGGPVEVAVSVSRPDDDRRCVQSFTVGVIAGGGR